MNDLFLIAPIMILGTVLLLGYALAAPRESTVQSRLKAYGYDPAERPAGDLSESFLTRVLVPLGKGLAAFAYRLTPVGMLATTRERLHHARVAVDPVLFVAIRLVAAVALPVLYVLFAFFTQGIGWLQIVLTFVLLFGGYRLPDIWLSLRIDGRRNEITRSLPDALDLIVVCVEAGNGLEQAIAKVVEASKGPLSEEFDQMLVEVSLGRTRREAMKAMSDRCGSPDLQTFVAAILQADQMGVNIANALRVQADAMRVRRRQRAEELIAKAPVKMVFPLAVFIFPALFVVLGGPALMRVVDMFAKMGVR